MTPQSGPAPTIGAVACTKVLIADDEPNIVVSLEFMMKREGFDVLVARDGRQALDTIRREHPRLVLLDATMPGMSGFDVCEAVRADADVRSTCIVMLTAKGRETDMARGVGAGADAYVTKPFSTRDLVQQVKDMLARDTAARAVAASNAAAGEMPKDLPA
ncbi:response regulator transcription factor [Xanthobacter versatilis]|uniref:response regulator transcription factor n=1 Tax=Xanthobacter autotrophicus (strain ATCC BAA-1158 / Py2) TaxID=78245 RepID=UPI003727059F